MKLKNIARNIALAAVAGTAVTACTDLDEKVYDRIDAGVYYQDENSLKGAVAPIYSTSAMAFTEFFWFLNELSADQVAWRTWNGGQWGYDEGQKFVLSTHTWNSESQIIRTAWEKAWTTIGLCNQLITDLEAINPTTLKITPEKKAMYIAEVRTLRAWAYYNNFELWGGALPLNVSVSGDIPGSADPDFNKGCKVIYDFIVGELDDCYADLMKEDGSSATRNRMNQATNRMLKMRMLLNAEVFIGENRYSECATLCEQLLAGDYGTYSLAADYRDIFGYSNNVCPEVVFAFAEEDGKLSSANMRNFPFIDSTGEIWKYIGANYSRSGQAGWNCCILSPSKDNSGTVLPQGGTDNPKSFILDYGDKLGGVLDRMFDTDVRKQNYVYDAATGEYQGIFLQGLIKADFGKGEPLKLDADRDKQDCYYVDQVGTFLNKGRNLETVMSPRWGETNSGVRLLKYPMLPESCGLVFQDIDEVEFRWAEVYYTLAECKMRAGDANGAKSLVNQVRGRYFTDKSVIEQPAPGFTAFDMDWMLSEWGVEFLNEGRRRRTDLRRFDKFTQGQWWFFGRATEVDRDLPAKRDRKYEWFPLPQSALMVNPGLVQNPNY